MDELTLIGVLLILVGFLALIAGALLSSSGQSKPDVTAGGVVFPGPLPIVSGSDGKTAAAAALLGALIMAAYYLFIR
jgi:uncharacterized protein (TIGR00304 family)